MSILQTALQEVGFKTTIRPRDVRRMQERDAVTASLESMADDVLAPMTRRPRKIQVQRAGTHLKIRYVGRPTFVLIDARCTPSEGFRKLRCFDGGAA